MNNPTKFVVILFLLATVNFAFSRNVTAYKLILKGVKLEHKGNHSGALKLFQKAINGYKKGAPEDSTSLTYWSWANYEVANTYFSLNDYNHCIEYADSVIFYHSFDAGLAYSVKGSALDMLGDPMQALETYRTGAMEYPDNDCLMYNLAYTLYNQKQFAEADKALEKSLMLNPQLKVAHQLMSHRMTDRGCNIKSVLALYNFLLINTDQSPGKDAYQLLHRQLIKILNPEAGESINLNDFPDAHRVLHVASVDTNQTDIPGKTNAEIFYKDTKRLFTVLADLQKDNHGFWWDYYVAYYSDMMKAGELEALCYIAAQSTNDPQVTYWIKHNKDKTDNLKYWSGLYHRK